MKTVQSPSPLQPEQLLEHASFVRAAAQAVLGGDDAVDDVVQDTWLKALTQAPPHVRSPRAWLGRVARNRAIDAVRTRRNVGRRERAASRSERAPSTISLVERAESGGMLVRAVLQLPPRYRDAILMRYYEGLPPRHIGEALGITAEAARTRVKRGLAQLRKTLDEQNDGNRRAWSAMLAPFARTPAAVGGTALLGVAMMKKLLLGAAVLIAAAAVWHFSSDRDRPPETTTSATTIPDPVKSPGLVPSPTTGPEQRAGDPGTARLTGRVRRNGESVLARVALRRIGGFDPGARWSLADRIQQGFLPAQGSAARGVDATRAGFVFDGVQAGRYEVRATADDGTWGFAVVSVRKEQDHRVDVLIRGGTHSILGRCIGSDGEPFAGTLLLQAFDYRALMYGRGKTMAVEAIGRDGRFAIDGVAPGLYGLTAVAAGGVRSTRRVQVPVRRPLTFVVDRGARTVSGRVMDRVSGTPIAGATVSASYGHESLVFFDRTARTDEQGRFTLHAGARAQLDVRAVGYASLHMRLGKGGDVALSLELDRPGTIRGRLAFPEGHAPIAGVPVYAIGLASNGWPRTAFARTVSGEDGSFVLSGAAVGHVVVFALGAGWASKDLGAWKIPGASPLALRVEAGQDAEATLPVVRAPSVEGTVFLPGGTPCEDVQVETTLVRGPTHLSAPLSSLWEHSPLGAHGRTRTGTDGRYRVDDLIPGGRCRVTATHTEHAPVSSEPFTAERGSSPIDLRVEEPRFANLIVREEGTNTPIPGATVHLSVKPDERTTMSTAFQFTTDDGGRARLGPLPAGHYVTGLYAQGYLPVSAQQGASFDIGPGPEPSVEAAMVAALRITGRVSAPQGVDVLDVVVTARGGQQAWSPPRASCDAEGAFSFDDLAAGSYELRATAQIGERLFRAETQATAGGEPVTMSLHEAERDRSKDGLLVRVQSHDGIPVYQGSATLFGRGVSGLGFSEHPFVIRYVPQGELWLAVQEAKDVTGAPMPVGAAIIGPIREGVAELKVTLPAEQRIRGRVERADGTGVAGVRIDAFPTHPKLTDHVRQTASPHSSAHTAEDGTFELRYLGDFSYELRAQVPSTFAPVEPVAAQAGTSDVVVVVRESASWTLRLRDPNGDPVEGARLRYRADPGSAAQREREQAARGPRYLARYVQGWWDERRREALRSDAAGQVTVVGLDPDTAYEVFVQGPQGRHGLAPIHRLALQPRSDDAWTFGQAYRIHGVVVDERGTPVPNARIERKSEDGRWRGIQSDGQGRFEFRGLARPEMEVRVYLGLRPPRDAPLHRLAAGEAVEIRIVAGAAVRLRVDDWKPEYRQPIAYLTPVDAKRRQENRLRLARDGTVVFQGLDETKTYVLWIPLRTKDGKHVYRRDIRPSRDEVVVSIEPGQSIRGTIRFTGETPADELRVQTGRGDVSGSSRVQPDGTFEITGLPAGIYPVRALAYRKVAKNGATTLELLGESTVEVETGTTARIDIPPR